MVARWTEPVVHDLAHAVRALRRRSGFTAIAVLSLAVGIGATTTMFAVVDTIDLRSLPYPGADRVVFISPYIPPDHYYNTPQAFFDRETASRAFSMVSGYRYHLFGFARGEE